MKANNQRIADVFMAYEERLRKLEAIAFPQQQDGLALVKDEVPA